MYIHDYDATTFYNRKKRGRKEFYESGSVAVEVAQFSEGFGDNDSAGVSADRPEGSAEQLRDGGVGVQGSSDGSVVQGDVQEGTGVSEGAGSESGGNVQERDAFAGSDGEAVSGRDS